jgi:hypothetical protein
MADSDEEAGTPVEPTSSPVPKKRKAPPSKAKAPEPEEEVFSGRLLVAAILAASMVVLPVSPLSALITRKSPTSAQRSAWKVGSSEELHLTVVTADYKKLGCADDRTAPNGAHCEFKSGGELFPRPEGAAADDNKLSILQPYRTTDGLLLYVAGLWAQPEVATRLHDEPAQGVAETKLARFVVSCRVSFLGEWSDPKLRWAPADKFLSPTNSDGATESTVMLGEVAGCRILEDERH